MNTKQLKAFWSLWKETEGTAEARLPRHVAIIMDGNGRWAKKHKLGVSLGHRQGTETLREIIRHTDDLGIEALSLYAFSTENWSRPAEEVAALMQLILDFFASEIEELCEKNVRILILGDKSALPDIQRKTLIEAEERTKANTGLHLNIGVNYGSRAELVRATAEIAGMVRRGEINPEDITEQTISDHLYTRGQPDVDLLIRTSGEMRLSNFLLYQNAYAEFIFPQTLWPDFTVEEYDRCLAAFGRRDRRYGGRTEEAEQAEGGREA
ncbi:MAG: isoprenyl transferase [Clostridia bacterium]|nr:isoprenyl transferase [Clostridia bacterium]